MKRRAVLVGAVSILPLVSTSGCLAENADESPSPENNTNSTYEGEFQQDRIKTLEIGVYNETSDELTAELTISNDESVPLDTELTIPGDEDVSMDSGITETGEYTITIELADGREKTWSVSIGSYSLREGTEMSIAMQTDELNFLKET